MDKDRPKGIFVKYTIKSDVLKYMTKKLYTV